MARRPRPETADRTAPSSLSTASVASVFHASAAALAVAAALLVCAGCDDGKRVGHVQGRRPVASKIAWAQARSLLAHCKVKAVEQTHNRLVTLTLRSGRNVYAYEPRLDLVVHELGPIQRRCGPITLAME
jgi:hypothetical protein